MVFDYPHDPHVRRHGPRGYTDYQNYKQWLRDEFTFRCIYCLRRERWDVDPLSNYCVEHIIPRTVAPDRACEYDNLVYACNRCNSFKGAEILELDPNADGFGDHLRVSDDGRIQGLTTAGEAVIRILNLNRSDLVNTRQRYLGLVRFLSDCPDPQAAVELQWLLGFPDNLPDLSSAKPPGGNDRKAGLEMSYFALRGRGVLPSTY